MTIYPKLSPLSVEWKQDWNGTWQTASDMEVQSIFRSCGSQGDDSAVLLLRYGVIVGARGTRVVQPITEIVANSYVRIKSGNNVLFVGVVVEGEDHSGATMSYNGNDVLTGNQIFRLVGASEILRRRPIWQSLWIPESQASNRENENEIGSTQFKIDWIPPYNGECRNYVSRFTMSQPNNAYLPWTSYESNMAVDNIVNPTKAGFGGARPLTLTDLIIYFNQLMAPNPAQPKLPTFNIVWSQDCNNTKTQKPLELDAPVVDNAYDVFRKLINPSASGLDFYFNYATDPITIYIFPAFAVGVDNNTDTTTLDLESPLIEDFPVIRNSFRQYKKYRFIGERITFVDVLAGAYHVSDYATNFVPLRPLTQLFNFHEDRSEYFGFNKFGIGDRWTFDWEKFQPEVKIKNDGTFQIQNVAFPKQTLYLRTLDWVVDKNGRKKNGPVVTISGSEFERRNRGGTYNYSDINDDNIAENQTYKRVDLQDVQLNAQPLTDYIGIAITDGECRRLYGGRDSDQFNRWQDISSDITDIKETVSDAQNVKQEALKYCYPDLCYDTMTATIAWESDQRTQVVFGDENAVDEQVVFVPGARLVIVRGYVEAGTFANQSPNVEKNEQPVGHFQDFEKIIQTMNNIAASAQNNRWGVSCSVRDILAPTLLGTVIQLERGGVETPTDCMVRTLEYSFPADGNATTRVN